MPSLSLLMLQFVNINNSFPPNIPNIEFCHTTVSHTTNKHILDNYIIELGLLFYFDIQDPQIPT